MTILLPTLAVTFAAICVWLTVRIVNRRERWAKCALAAAVGVPVIYVASFGPACWISSRTETGAGIVAVAYQPIIRIVFEPAAPDSVVLSIVKYAELLSAPGWMFSRTGGDGNFRCHWGIVI